VDGDLLTPIPPVNQGKFPLTLYDGMCRAIDAAYTVDEAKDIRDRALAFEIYARQAKNVEAERRACKVRLRAERKAGQLDKQRQKAKAGPPRTIGFPMEPINRGAPTLAELGVSKKQAHTWRKLADVPQELFDAVLVDPDRKPTTAGIIAAATPPEPEVIPVSKDALWLWGRLRDFERDGLLAQLPGDVLLTMTPQMLDDVHRLAPTVSAWLRQIGAADV
jgi:hypothetical protein